MTQQTLVFPPGSAIAFTTGAYSDFRLTATLITLKQCDLAACAQEYSAKYQAENDWDTADPDGLPAWLIVNGYAMAAEIQTVHLGDYGDFEPEFGVVKPE